LPEIIFSASSEVVENIGSKMFPYRSRHLNRLAGDTSSMSGINVCGCNMDFVAGNASDVVSTAFAATKERVADFYATLSHAGALSASRT
jgi:hypothetical protein